MSETLAPARARAGLSPARIGAAACSALLAELVCFPKPGLVSFVDRGAHRDMDAGTFLASIGALEDYFPAIAQAGAAGSPLSELRRLGLLAERRMLRATDGVNTHRGAVFALGLLCAAAARLGAAGAPLRGEDIARAVPSLWGDELATAAAPRPGAESHGERASRLYNAAGARGEAMGGFPALRQAVLPALRRARDAGACEEQAAVEAFLASVAVLEDTNLLHRAGPEGLRFARDQAAGFLRAGGIRAPAGPSRALALHRAFVARWLSPGGSADMLSAALFLDAIES